jgi:hypothetical protein
MAALGTDAPTPYVRLPHNFTKSLKVAAASQYEGVNSETYIPGFPKCAYVMLKENVKENAAWSKSGEFDTEAFVAFVHVRCERGRLRRPTPDPVALACACRQRRSSATAALHLLRRHGLPRCQRVSRLATRAGNAR